jgi:hypothetical protein
MSNAQIIFNESVELMKAGVIGTTGRTVTITVEKEGQKVKETINEPEPIHTYKTWQRLGYQVEKGQKAIAMFTIWNFAENKKADDEEENEAPSLMKNGHYYMKKAAFFKGSQVKKAGEDKPAAVPEKEPEPAPEVKKAPAKTKTPCTQKAFDYIVKNASRNAATRNMNGLFEGTCYACDGFQVMKTKNPVCDNDIMSHVAESLNKMIAFTKDYTKTGSIGLTAKEIKAGIKEAKAGRRNAKVIYVTTEGIAINANFLYNAIMATGSSSYTYKDTKSPVHFQCPQTEYIVCPINCQKELAKGFHVIG